MSDLAKQHDELRAAERQAREEWIKIVANETKGATYAKFLEVVKANERVSQSFARFVEASHRLNLFEKRSEGEEE